MGDSVKVGKVCLKVVLLETQTIRNSNHYVPIINHANHVLSHSDSVIRDSFVSNIEGEESSSLGSESPMCRYCYSRSVSRENYFIGWCGCSGSCRYLHAQCLKNWVLTKPTTKYLVEKKVYCFSKTSLMCELCNDSYPIDKVLPLLIGNEKKDYVVLSAIDNGIVNHSHQNQSVNQEMFFVVLLDKRQEFTIGRSSENDIKINDCSVSRKHCRFFYEN